jgi:hypothetical protein
MFETPYVKIAQETQVRPASTRKMVPGTTEFYSDVPEALRKKMEMFQVRIKIIFTIKNMNHDLYQHISL